MTESARSTPAARAGAARARGPVGSPTGVRPLGRVKNRRKAGPLHKAGMIVFCAGLLAICVDAGMFAAGVRDMPWWLHLITVLAPLGLAIGLVGTVLDARKHSED